LIGEELMKKDLGNPAEIPCVAAHCLEPLHHLEEQLLRSQVEIEVWLRAQWRKTVPPFYASVDLRNAGFKVAPVDTNLFPAGFNNLKEDFIPLAVQAAQEALERLASGCRRILLIPENHTRNRFYFENLAVLHDLLIQAGFEVRLGSLLENIPQKKTIALPSGRTLLLEKIEKTNQQLHLNNFLPCLIILNNDLSSGIPEILQGVTQKIFPAMEMGWHRRLKSEHFAEYTAVCNEFAQIVNIDPWLISPLFSYCEGIDFMKGEGEECMVEKSHELFEQIQKKYDQYHIKEKPYVVIKSDAGTYGRGVLTIHDTQEIKKLNRKKRSDMRVAKGNRPIHRVIIQEGIYTFETWQNAVAEPVVYMLGQYVIGGFYRIHVGKGISDNLNAPGMQFKPLPFVKACNIPEVAIKQKAQCANRLYIYGVIARLALLAAAREQVALLKK
jgi:glutamate--cysteine ligase